MRVALLLAVLAAAQPSAVDAQTSATSVAIAQARSAGLVGERYDGYLGIAVDGGPLLRRQVNATNLLRRSLYAQLSQARGVTMQEVGVTAACQLLGTVQVGEHYMLSGNMWRVRQPGQPAPIPDYCR